MDPQRRSDPARRRAAHLQPGADRRPGRGGRRRDRRASRHPVARVGCEWRHASGEMAGRGHCEPQPAQECRVASAGDGVHRGLARVPPGPRRGARPALGRGRRRPRAVRMGDGAAGGPARCRDRGGAREPQPRDRGTPARRVRDVAQSRGACRAGARCAEGRRAGGADPARGRARHRDRRRRRGRVRTGAGVSRTTRAHARLRRGACRRARDHGRGAAAGGHRGQHVVARQAVRPPRRSG